MEQNDRASHPNEQVATWFNPVRTILSLLGKAMGRGRSLWIMLFASIGVTLALPLANMFVIYPAFTSVLVDSIEEDAEKMGSYLVPPELRFREVKRESLSQRLYGDIYKLEHDFGLAKLKIYSHDGEILYSTNSADIGQVNKRPYFTEVVVKGQRFTMVVEKGRLDAEGEEARMDVVETYLPLMNGERFLGAFELHYDITDRKRQLDNLLLYSTLMMSVVSLCLVVAVIVLMKTEAASQLERDKAEALKGDIERITRHDMKAPFIGLLSGMEYLETFTQLDGEQASTVSDMREAATQGLEMVNRSLGLYRMETGTYEYCPTDLDLIPLTRSVVSNLSGLAVSQGVEISILSEGQVINEETTLPFRVEEPLFYSLLANLVKNGIEASEYGERVLITLARDGGVKLTVHNPTPVPEDIRETFFEKYVTSGKAKGTGIGTYSARLMVHTMGGTIKMETADDMGTLVTVRLPLPPSPEV